MDSGELFTRILCNYYIVLVFKIKYVLPYDALLSFSSNNISSLRILLDEKDKRA